MKAVITFEVEAPDTCTPEDFEEWVGHCVQQDDTEVSPDNPLNGIEFSFFDCTITSVIYPPDL